MPGMKTHLLAVEVVSTVNAHQDHGKCRNSSMGQREKQAEEDRESDREKKVRETKIQTERNR